MEECPEKELKRMFISIFTQLKKRNAYASREHKTWDERDKSVQDMKTTIKVEGDIQTFHDKSD